MELKFVVPDVDKTFGVLEFAGENDVNYARVNGVRRVTSRSYNLFSQIRKTDNITVVIPASAGEKRFTFKDRIELVNPRIKAESHSINGIGYVDYTLYADDMVKVN